MKLGECSSDAMSAENVRVLLQNQQVVEAIASRPFLHSREVNFSSKRADANRMDMAESNNAFLVYLG